MTTWKPDRPVRVVIATDAEILAEGVRSMLRPSADRVEVLPSVSIDAMGVLDALVSADADVLILDADSRSMSGPDVVVEVTASAPSTAILVLTHSDDLSRMLHAIWGGVKGFLLKSVSTDALVAAVIDVAAGETVIDAGLATGAALLAAQASCRSSWEGAHLGLSRRESEVLRLLAGGSQVNAIAEELRVGRETVRTHLRQVYRKLGVNDRVSAVAVAWREGLGA